MVHLVRFADLATPWSHTEEADSAGLPRSGQFARRVDRAKDNVDDEIFGGNMRYPDLCTHQHLSIRYLSNNYLSGQRDLNLTRRDHFTRPITSSETSLIKYIILMSKISCNRRTDLDCAEIWMPCWIPVWVTPWFTVMPVSKRMTLEIVRLV